MFLRTSEFLWQEGHTAHETSQEAVTETMKMLEVYVDFAKEFLAVPMIHGSKTESERFAGAVETYAIEAMSQDKKAIQAGTSHFLGQNFAKANEIKFVGRDNKEAHAWTTSWGVSTRLIGTMIMVHSDDNGLILPPPVAPAQIAILPILSKPESRESVLKAAQELKHKLESQSTFGSPIRVELDTRDIGGGTKNWEWIKKGVPVRVEIGPRDVASGNLVYSIRSDETGAKSASSQADFVANISRTLVSIRDAMYARALKFQTDNTKEVSTPEELEKFFACAEKSGTPGFAITPWEGFEGLEEKMREKFGVTVRCHPLDKQINGKQAAIWAQSY
jgi:prolyl-tRNA synthetase